MIMKSEILLGAHFLAELLTTRYQYARVPEPDLVMDNPENVREYRDAGLADGNGSSVYLLNLLLLCGKVRPGSLVVDLACGPANLLVELAKLNPQAQFIGVDLSAEMLRWAEGLRASSGVPNVRFIEGDITQLSTLTDNSADIVMSTLSLHHLPSRALLEQCFREIARIVKPAGAIHLMDFASLKRSATTQYFVYERTKGLGRFLAQDYENSLRAAYRTEDFEILLPILQAKVPGLHLRRTFGVPFLVALSSLKGEALTESCRQGLSAYWQRMQRSQRKDFEAMRLFFRLGGLQVPRP